ncbi:hypothetical protein ACFL1O_00380 [Patescibacteria group bacterium]
MTKNQKIYSVLVIFIALGLGTVAIFSQNETEISPEQVAEIEEIPVSMQTSSLISSIGECEIIIQNLENQIVGLKNKIKNLEEQLENLLAEGPEIKEIIKEVLVEKIVIKEVIKEVVKEVPCEQDAPQITSIEVVPDINSAIIKWGTDRLTKSEVVVTGGGIVGQKIISSVFDLASNHRVNVTGLKANTSYDYEISATTIRSRKMLGTTKKSGSFVTELEELTDE